MRLHTLNDDASLPIRPRRRRVRRSPLLVEERQDGVYLPVVPITETVVFPRMVVPLSIERERSLRAIEAAMLRDRLVVIVAQRNQEAETVEFSDLYDVGTEVVVGRVLKLPDGTESVLVQGQRRVRLAGLKATDDHQSVLVTPVTETVEKSTALEALMRAVLALFEKCVKLSSRLSEEAYVAAMNADEPGWLADVVVSSLELTNAQRQEILETIPPAERLEKVNVLLAHELAVLELEDRIQSHVQQEVDKSQREYLLREQLRAIQKELGEVDAFTRDVNDLRDKLVSAGLPDVVRIKAEEEMRRLEAMPAIAPEVGVIRTYLDWLANLPWSAETEDHIDLDAAARTLDENHFGLPKVKERILEFMAVRKLSGGRTRMPILSFVGPPGVGKTSLGRSIAQALGRRFARISLGGIRDEAEIRGHRRTYVGALPGRIIQTMRTAGTTNPVFMLDEIDKLGVDFRGDPSAALLEILDPEQNAGFSDHYLDVPYDLSHVLFLTTANILDPIPPALTDRLEIIHLPGYIEDEKLQIARRFLIPKMIVDNGLENGRLQIVDDTVRQIVRSYTNEAGVRNLEREIGSICRKVARSVAQGGRIVRKVRATGIEQYLGPPRFIWGLAEEHDEVGVATGVYWTATGGDLATVEATVLAGKGELILTGQLGTVMKESATAALSYIRSRSGPLGIGDKLGEKVDIHIHLPAGAVPKDGPSAGITMATAITSALTQRPVRRDVAMTGEITLRGRVLAIGGLREKALAVHRAGITTFLYPRRNERDLREIPERVRRELKFVAVDHMDEVLALALRPEANGSAVIAPLTEVPTTC